MTPSERNALFFFSAVAVLGAGVRLYRASRGEEGPPASARAALEAQIAAVDSARASRASKGSRGSRAKERNRAPPPSSSATPSIPLDLDTAPAESLLRLPRIGPALAKRIIADRDSLGPFGSLEGFERVKGVGPAMTKALAPYVTFSGTPRPSPVGARVTRSGRGASRDAPGPRAPR